jgi:ribosomal protein S27AE
MTPPKPVPPLPDVCPRCGESLQLAKIKGCIVCLKCHFKYDCNGW